MSLSRLQSAGELSPGTQVFSVPGEFTLECGKRLAEVNVAYRTWGTLNANADNAVLVCHALTGSADADEWWPGLIGEGCALDPAHDFIVCSNVLAGCYGTSGPFSFRPDTQHRYANSFPTITIRDMVGLQRLLIDALGINELQLVIGPSLGGMQTLEWAASFPERVKRIAPIGVCAKHSAWCIGISEAQRAAIEADPNWQGGAYDDASKPTQGLAAARMMAMVSYRSWENFESRFARAENQRDDFSVASYLRYQGDKLVKRFDAASYVRLTQAMDTHDLARGRGVSLEQVTATMAMPALVVSVSSDVLYPPREQEALAALLPRAQYRQLVCDEGHDGFLINMDELSKMIREFRRAND